MTLVRPVETTTTPASLPDEVVWHSLTPEEACARLGVDSKKGLDAAEVERRRAKVGPNKFAEAKSEPRWRAFLRQYRDPMQIVLLIAGLGSIWPLHELGTGLVIVFLALFNAVLGLRQEGKAAEAVAALQKMMIVKARVQRDGHLTQVPAEQLVPGDVVSIEAGDVVPADGRLLSAATLEIAESALTGESVPVSKGVEAIAAEDAPLGDRTDMVYMNTNATRGAGEFVVTSTGMATEVGHISHLLQAEGDVKTPLTRQLEKLTGQILFIAGAAVIVSIVLNMSRGESFKTVFTAAIAFAIAGIPTGLPAVVTTILSYGTQVLAQAGAIVKRLRSTETLGSTSAINSDKTGTLTLNQMTAVEMALWGRRYTLSGSGYLPDAQIKRVAGDSDVALDAFLQPMVLAADAVATAEGEMIGDPTEGALVVLAEKGGIDPAATREQYPRLAELPFDTAYKLMATFHRMQDESGREVIRCFVKGAPDQLLARATSGLDPDLRVVPVDDEGRERYLAENTRLGEQGLRVLATGRKDFEPESFEARADLLPLIDGLTLLSLVGIVDPPRPTPKAAIETAKSAGIQVRMITGDHAVTAAAIAKQLGIEGRAISGAEFGAMSDDELLEEIDGVGVIARVTPEHKVRLIDTLKRKGHIVAMTGDGVNDAPALKKADIGIAMGITGTEVSKEAAAMILTDDNFATIVRAVELGRALYDNLVRYIRFQMAALFGFIATFLGASVLWIAQGMPFLPLQTLWVNFTVQVFLAVGLGYGKAREGLMKDAPRSPLRPILPSRLLAYLVFVGVVISVLTLGVIAWATPLFGEAVARTMGLTTFAFTNIWFAIETADEEASMFSATTLANPTLLKAAGLALVATVATSEIGLLNRILDTVNLTTDQWLVALVVSLGVIVVAELKKLLRIQTSDKPRLAEVPVEPVAAAA